MVILKPFLFILLILPLEAITDIEKEIYKKIAHILLHKKHIHITTSSKECQNADILFLNTLKNTPKECLQKPIILTNLHEYKKYKNRAVGSFFWQKGRAQILFNPHRLQQLNIKIGKRYEKYLDN